MATLDVLDVEEVYAEFGRRVLQERLCAGWTQGDVAGQVGLSRASIANIESGRQRVLLHDMLRFAEIFSVTPSEMIGIGVDETPASARVKRLQSENAALRHRVAALEILVRGVAERCANAVT